MYWLWLRVCMSVFYSILWTDRAVSVSSICFMLSDKKIQDCIDKKMRYPWNFVLNSELRKILLIISYLLIY